jgi:methionyl-tRNA synthetase
MDKKIFIGVAWPYVNGDLHVGHVAGYLLPADLTARYYRIKGTPTLMVSGSDCFGTPITVEADKKGVSPREVVAEYHARNLKLFEDLGISFDLYTKTDTDNHRKITQDFLLAFYKKGLLAVEEQKQYYSESLSRFLPDRYVEGKCPHCGFEGARSDQCDNCGQLLDQNLVNPVAKIDQKPVSLKETKHLFIDWSKLQGQIEEFFGKAEGWRPWVVAETKKWLDEGLRSRAVTRDLDWGVEIPNEIAKDLPGAENKRVYVWFDAVIGYFSASVQWATDNGGNWEDFWKGKDLTHYYFMGKDNLVFHTIFWPGQLMSYDESLHLPDRPAINQYLNLEGKKFSKSRGVIVDTREFIDRFGADPLRFYLTSVMPENADSNFAWADFEKKNNSMLVGHIGNYVHRSLSIYKELMIGADVSDEIRGKVSETFGNAGKAIEESRFRDYVGLVEELASFANGKFDDKKPWVSKKSGDKAFEDDAPDLVYLAISLLALMKILTPASVDQMEKVLAIDLNKFWDEKGRDMEFVKVSQRPIPTVNPLYKKVELETE